MSFHSSYEVENGDIVVSLLIFSCDQCAEQIHESWPRYQDGDFHLCTDCALKQGKFTAEEYLSSRGMFGDFQVAVDDEGDIQIWKGDNPIAPWKREGKEQRNSLAYRQWRSKVFERDDYTCQHCHKRGGELNAHHIKPFAKYKKDRYKINNGITLCIDCHKEEHRKR